MTILDSILTFLKSGQIQMQENVYYCETRDQANGRIHKWMNSFIKSGLDQNRAAILSAIMGEITNNCFDHNLGMWNGPSGCIVGLEINSQAIHIYIADRGQGIISTLSKVFPKNTNPKEILKKAFEERVSGRAPEKRGNGLKFVNLHIKNNKNSLVCFTQHETYVINSNFLKIENSQLPADYGTLICINWSLHES